MKFLKYALASVAVATLVACGGGGGGSSGTTVAAADITVGINAANGAQIVSALEAQALNYTNGVPDFGTNGTPTSLTIAGTGTGNPTFNIGAGGFTATGDLTFGSCRFKITTSTFPVGHPLSVGQTITVDPCQLVAETSGQTTGVPVETNTMLVLNSVRPEPVKTPVTITPTGEVQLRTPSGAVIPLGSISVTTVTGGS